ncbi:hypothetical protein MtrunA17_Chr5g0446281 [Medicago truncatula]|uniref:Reverse transcriptase zinc-binding domain-containing protein n=1 Tax=Medicago truncatula TaxID=3880 RepID=A0A396I2Y6_MEDTR|nr:hypothetical protein MtrunA17_Chr5g0446281 [Medicago truncatula]
MKDNLFARGVIPLGNNTCVAGCGDIETIQHLFVSCPYSAAVWGNIRSSLGISSVEPYRVSEHFYQFVHSIDGSSTCRSFMQLIWLCGMKEITGLKKYREYHPSFCRESQITLFLVDEEV